MAYQTLFSPLGIHHVNTGIKITQVQCMKETFMLVFDLSPDGFPSDSHISLPDNSKNTIELNFDESLF